MIKRKRTLLFFICFSAMLCASEDSSIRGYIASYMRATPFKYVVLPAWQNFYAPVKVYVDYKTYEKKYAINNRFTYWLGEDNRWHPTMAPLVFDEVAYSVFKAAPNAIEGEFEKSFRTLGECLAASGIVISAAWLACKACEKFDVPTDKVDTVLNARLAQFLPVTVYDLAREGVRLKVVRPMLSTYSDQLNEIKEKVRVLYPDAQEQTHAKRCDNFKPLVDYFDVAECPYY